MVQSAHESDAVETVAALERAAAADPEHFTLELAWSYGALGDVHRREGNDPEWLGCYELAVRVTRELVSGRQVAAPAHWDLQQHLFNLVNVAQAVGEHDLALRAATEASERAAELDPSHAPVQFLFGSYLARLEQLQASVAHATAISGQESAPR